MRLLKEPVLHFLALGGLLFAIDATLGSSREAAPDTAAIRITAADADWLREMWTRQWHRPPTDEELVRLVTDHLTEEVLAREAKALELDVGDTVVRRRLAQKMSFLINDTIRVAEPPEAELRALYEKRPDLAQTPPRVSFTQIFFRREHGDARARASLAALSGGSTVPEEEGDSLLLGDVFADQDEQTLSNLFGASFAQAVLVLPAGRWSGPIESGYGLHLVKVTAASPPQTRPYPEIRERLAEEWRRDRQEEAHGQLLKGLMRKYNVMADPSIRPWLRMPPGEEVRP